MKRVGILTKVVGIIELVGGVNALLFALIMLILKLEPSVVSGLTFSVLLISGVSLVALGGFIVWVGDGLIQDSRRLLILERKMKDISSRLN